MTAVLSGTNGLLQSYDYQVLTTGFSYTFAAGVQTLVINPAGTLATGTITMPASPSDGMTITVESTQQVTAITVNANTGQSIVGAPSQLVPNQPMSWVYRLANTTWYPFIGGAGRASSLVSGTAVTLTTQTSVDFTGIPSWVRRITVVSNQTRTSGTSYKIVQIGGGSVETSGYLSTGSYYFGGSSGGVANATTGFLLNATSSSSEFTTGHLVLTQVSTNIWVSSSTATNPNGSLYGGASGVKTTSNTLDRIRYTTVNGTDQLNSGSVNILYE